MVTISSLWFMILIEALVVTTLIALVLIVLSVVRKSRDRKAAAVIIQKIKEDEARRTAETKKIMLHKFGFEDGDAEKLAVRTDRAERVFYQSIINMYLQRESSALEGLNITFETAVETYRTLEPPGGGSGGSIDESQEMTKLRAENKRLSEEIGVTMQTMGRMLSEYSAMFAEKAKEQESELQQEAEPQEPEETQDELIEDESEGQAEESAEEYAVEAEYSEEEDMAEAAAELEEIADEAIDELVDSAQDAEHSGGGDMVEEMDDLSDLDMPEDKDLKDLEAPENPDELIG